MNCVVSRHGAARQRQPSVPVAARCQNCLVATARLRAETTNGATLSGWQGQAASQPSARELTSFGDGGYNHTGITAVYSGEREQTS